MTTTHDSYQDLGVTFPEEVTRTLTFPLLKEDGTGYTAASIVTAELTLYDRRTREIINSRDKQDVKNLNGGTLTDGQLKLVLAPADMVIKHPEAVAEERHVALLRFVADPGAMVGIKELEFGVANLQRHP